MRLGLIVTPAAPALAGGRSRGWAVWLGSILFAVAAASGCCRSYGRNTLHFEVQFALSIDGEDRGRSGGGPMVGDTYIAVIWDSGYLWATPPEEGAGETALSDLDAKVCVFNGPGDFLPFNERPVVCAAATGMLRAQRYSSDCRYGEGPTERGCALDAALTLEFTSIVAGTTYEGTYTVDIVEEWYGRDCGLTN
jgi:hypothetical protein